MVDTSNLNKTGLYQLILHRGSAFKKHLFEKKHAKLTVLCEDVLVYGRSIFSPHETRLRRDSVRPSVPYRKMYGYDSSPAGQMRSTRTTFVGLPLRLIRSRYLLRGRNAFTRGVGSTVGTLSQKARSRPPPHRGTRHSIRTPHVRCNPLRRVRSWRFPPERNVLEGGATRPSVPRTKVDAFVWLQKRPVEAIVCLA